MLDRWRREPSAERLAKRREKEAKRREKERGAVFEQLRAATVSDRPEGGGNGLLSEPVLVFRGPLHGDLKVFDQEAKTVGTAHAFGGWRSELHDADGSALLVIEGYAWLSFSSWAFVLKGRDGKVLAEIGPPRWKLSHTVRPITFGAGSLGIMKIGLRPFSRRSAIEDAVGNEVAQIHCESKGEYVVQIASSVAGPLRAVAVAAGIVLDLATHERNV